MHNPKTFPSGVRERSGVCAQYLDISVQGVGKGADGSRHPAWLCGVKRRHTILRLSPSPERSEIKGAGTSIKKGGEITKISSLAIWWTSFLPKTSPKRLEEVVPSSNVQTPKQGYKGDKKIGRYDTT